jgi:ATP-dependent DNA helicase RecQ
MHVLAFIDTEVDPRSGKILDIGCLYDHGPALHSTALPQLAEFLRGADFLCGHNILAHDLKYLRRALPPESIPAARIIDTLYWSPLLFPQKPYHALVKDDKLHTEEVNNPLNDARKARDLFHDEMAAFAQLALPLKRIFYHLLHEQPAFAAFFHYSGFQAPPENLPALIAQTFRAAVCEKADLPQLAAAQPVELAYALALIHSGDRYSITPPWVLKNYPATAQALALLRNRPCLEGCGYCRRQLDVREGLKTFFGFDAFRTYEGEPLQEQAARCAVENRSLLAIFPTGGGKSIAFQVPALLQGHSMRGLTVVISPLQSLMKDQVDNLEKAGITEAVTINGLLDPIERAKSFERVADGSAALLYIAPESLRSKSIERLLLDRNVVRFVVDEAHCFSTWGQDFRVDYLYIGDFIKRLQTLKNLPDPIPVSCFTATARQKVIEDICRYFKDKLGLELEIFRTGVSRKNLRYRVFEDSGDEEKYRTLRDLVADRQCPAIVYVSRTRRADDIARRLCDDGFNARAFHGKMDPDEKTKNQNAFIAGEVQIMVATSAFGMGVDKKDVGLVVHYDISDSLENYVQEAGRAGRDERIEAECFILFNEEDLNKHFILLNQTKLNIGEIKQIWNAVKFITKFRSKVSNSPLEIARQAGWDDGVSEIETRVITAIAALEDAGYLVRGQNAPRVYANSIQSRTAQEAIDKIQASALFDDDRQRTNAVRIIRKLIASRRKAEASNGEAFESRIDYISDHLGIPNEEVIRIVQILRQEKILADAKDLTAFVRSGNRSMALLESFRCLEMSLLRQMGETEATYSLKKLNEQAEAEGCPDSSPRKIKTILNFWAIKNWVKRRHLPNSNHLVVVKPCEPVDALAGKLEKRHELARFIIEVLGEKAKAAASEASEEVLVEFSVLELKTAFERRAGLFQSAISPAEVEDALFYLSRIAAMKIEGGFLVVYNRLTIERLEGNNRAQYKIEDYQKLNGFYENKVQQIHIVGEYAKKMVSDYVGALRFVDDYFQLNYASFLGKYFPGSRQNEIRRNITPAKYRQLFESLSPLQRQIIDDKESPHIVVAAGPGSGKTKTLVHKLAALLLMEDVKHEQLLMLTFSRAAATEFKKRLIELIGNAARFVEIKTFHAYCFDLLGKVGSLEKSGTILKAAIEKIRSGEIEPGRIAKSVLVLDEAQDMDADEFALVKALMEQNEGMRVIAVGDDDQNIFEFRGADSRHMACLMQDFQAKKYEMGVNYRSARLLTTFANAFAQAITQRLKTGGIEPHRQEDGALKIVRYQSPRLVVPLVEDLLATDLSGTTCVLTQTNDEAVQVAGLLVHRGRKARLIQSNDGFPLLNLLEVRLFMEALRLDEAAPAMVIPEALWEKAKRAVFGQIKSSPHFDMLRQLVQDFEETHPKSKYRTDFEAFVDESNLDDFFRQDGDTIFVSTIHKAKGREFDNVFLLLDGLPQQDDATKRKLYVALTRAKNRLVIHTNGAAFDAIKIPGVEVLENSEAWALPKLIAVTPGHREVYLGYFPFVQHRVEALASGQPLKPHAEGLADEEGRLVLKFSRSFQEKMEDYLRMGYTLREARVNFLVFWKNREDDREYRVVLPWLVWVLG